MWREYVNDWVKPPETRGPETMQAGLMALWGLRLLMPWSTFTVSPAWDALRRLAPEPAWGLGFALLGGLRLWASLTDWPRMRRLTAFAACVAWSGVSAGFIAGAWQGTGTVIYPFLALSAALSYLRQR